MWFIGKSDYHFLHSHLVRLEEHKAVLLKEIKMITSPKEHSDIKSKIILIYKLLLEVGVFLLVVLLAALIGNYVALLGTRQITNEITRFIVGILIGLLVGIGVGISVKRSWEKIQQVFIKWHRSKSII